MNQLTDIEDVPTKLKIYKALLSDIVSDTEVMQYLQNYIDDLEKQKEQSKKPAEQTESETAPGNEDLGSPEEFGIGEDVESDTKEIIVEAEDDDDDSFLPSPDDLGLDLVDK